MASSLKNLSTYDSEKMPDASALSFGIVVADWNAEITHALYKGCIETLEKQGVKPENIHFCQVPGAFELPAAARLLLNRYSPDAIICLGCVIKGETQHDEYINMSVAHALQNLSIMQSRPCVFGVLTPNNAAQALARAGGEHGNKGVEAAQTAIRMAALRQELSSIKKGSIGF
jgi:6,7-dimethyl-8-ribityllumazine synthase